MKQPERLYQRFPPISGGGSGGAVTSVFGRVGDVLAQAGDYIVSQVTGAVPNTIQVSANAPLSGGGALTANVTVKGSPWTSDSDSGGFGLGNANRIAIGAPLATAPPLGPADLFVNATAGHAYAVQVQQLDATRDAAVFCANNFGVWAALGVAGSSSSAGGRTINLPYIMANALGFIIGGNEVARFASTGNFGIGTQSPSANLHVVGTTFLPGNVGIGPSASLAYPLTIREAPNLNLLFTVSSPTNIAAIQVVNDAVNAYVPIQYMASIHSFMQGNVGIGTTAPTSPLIVHCATNANLGVRSSSGTAIEIFNSNDANSAYQPLYLSGSPIDFNGNVGIGIGTAIPTAPLQVGGLVTYASDAAAGTGGLTAGAFYKDSSGGLHVKL